MSINDAVSVYLAAKEAESAARKRAEEAKKRILAHAGSADSFTTDVWTVILKRSVSVRLDTKKLYTDFGEADIKRDYGRESISVTVDAVPAAQATTATA